MALHNLKIVVYDGGKANSSSLGTNEVGDDDSKGGKKKEKSRLYKVLNYNQTVKEKIQKATSPTTYYALQQGVSLAVQTGRQFINYYVSDIGRSSGDSNYQAIVNRRIEQITDGLSVAQGALGGAAAGAMFGPVGAAVGAVAGIASSSINLGFKYAERERTYQHQMFEEQNSQAYQLARANYSAMTGRVR